MLKRTSTIEAGGRHMDYIHEIGKRAKSVSAQVQHLSQNQKNEGLRRVAEELENQKSYLIHRKKPEQTSVAQAAFGTYSFK